MPPNCNLVSDKPYKLYERRYVFSSPRRTARRKNAKVGKNAEYYSKHREAYFLERKSLLSKVELTAEDLVQLLRLEICLAGGRKIFAERIKYHRTYLTNILAGRAKITRPVAQALGFELVTTYRRIENAK